MNTSYPTLQSVCKKGSIKQQQHKMFKQALQHTKEKNSEPLWTVHREQGGLKAVTY